MTNCEQEKIKELADECFMLYNQLQDCEIKIIPLLCDCQDIITDVDEALADKTNKVKTAMCALYDFNDMIDKIITAAKGLKIIGGVTK